MTRLDVVLFAVARRPRCWLRGHDRLVLQTGDRLALVVCARCLVGAADLPLASAPALLAAAGDPLELALRVAAAAVDGDPGLVALSRAAAGSPQVVAVLAGWLAASWGEDWVSRAVALRALSLRVQLDGLGW